MRFRDPGWRLAHSGHELRQPADGYAWQNRGRRPHGLCVFQYTLSGSLAFEQGGRVQDVPPGHAVLFHYGDDSSYAVPPDAPEPYETRWANLAGAGLLDHFQALRARHGSVVDLRRRRHVLRTLLTLTRRGSAHLESDPLAATEEVHRFVLTLSRALQDAADRTRSPALRAIAQLRDNPVYPWSLKQLAEDSGCSREHLSRTFADQTGMSPARYLNEQRLQVACELLRESALPISEVARQSGFGSAHTLARLLRHQHGVSPSDYRRGASGGQTGKGPKSRKGRRRAT